MFYFSCGADESITGGLAEYKITPDVDDIPAGVGFPEYQVVAQAAGAVPVGLLLVYPEGVFGGPAVGR